MKFDIKLDKEQLKVIGAGAGKIGKAIIVEGTKAVILKGAAAVITQSFDEGLGGVKELSMDDVLKGGKKYNKPKKTKVKKKVTEELVVNMVPVDTVLDDIGEAGETK